MRALPKPPLVKFLAVLALVAALQSTGLLSVRPAAAGSEGCVRSAAPARPSGPPDHPVCEQTSGGPYCYQCAEQPGDSGSNYTICSQYQDGTGSICGDFESLPDWFGGDPDNQDPGFGDLG